jgi:DNA-binding transcriptional LysR family regulator
MALSLEQLRALDKVVQSGSFTRAAELLNTQKSHVSRLVAQLEVELGAKLLERTTRQLAVTELGREVHERARSILAAVEDTRRVSREAHAEPRGVLRLTCGVEFGLAAVGPWIDEFIARYPRAAVEAEYTSRVIDLVHEGFDVAIRVGPLPESRLVARRLGQIDYGLFASPGYLASAGAPRTPAELPQHALVMFTIAGRARGWTLQRAGRGEPHRVAPTARLRFNNSLAVRDALLRGSGIGQLPLLIATAAAARGELVRVLPEWATEAVPVHAVYPSNRYLAPNVRAFVDVAVHRLAAAAASEHSFAPPPLAATRGAAARTSVSKTPSRSAANSGSSGARMPAPSGKRPGR